MHPDNCFITLTYDEVNIPSGGTLVKSDLQKFFKRLRKLYSSIPIRYFSCGEYGDINNRPHYHAIIFGINFPDQVLFSTSAKSPVYTSSILSTLWRHGFSTVGAANFETAAYCARYVCKKVTGKPADRHYESVDEVTGEVVSRLPEFALMSLKPGIGYSWFNNFTSDVFPSDQVVVRGNESCVPRYYDKLYERGGADLGAIKHLRTRRASRFKSEQLPDRLASREAVQKSRVSTFLKRKI